MAKGQKVCPKCLKTFGPRKKKCDCGYDFPIKYAPEKAAARRAAVVEKKEEKVGPPLIFTCSKEWAKQMPKIPAKLNVESFKSWLLEIKDTPIKLPPYLNGAWGYFSRSAVRCYLQRVLKKKDFDIVTVWLEKYWAPHSRELINRRWGTDAWRFR